MLYLLLVVIEISLHYNNNFIYQYLLRKILHFKILLLYIFV